MHTTLQERVRQQPAAPVAGIAILTLLAMLLVLTPAPMQLVSVDANAEAQFVERINQSRAAAGLPALRVASDLTAAARDHSAVMSAQSKLHHNPDLGTDVRNWRRVAENVGVGYGVSSLHNAFMDSPGHRANILDNQVTEVGIGVFAEGSGRIWVTEVFRLPTSGSSSSSSSSSSGSSGSSGSSSSSSSAAPRGGIPLWGDWDGDGVATPGRWRNGVFYLSNRQDGGGALIELAYGRATDTPVVGDWDGDGTDTIGVVRGNRFILRNEYRSGADDIVMAYGRDTDTPVVGDWDGNGTDTLGVVRGNRWILRNVYRSGADDIVMEYGRDSDFKVTGDFNGDGRDTLGVVRGERWILRYEYRRGADLIIDY